MISLSPTRHRRREPAAAAIPLPAAALLLAVLLAAAGCGSSGSGTPTSGTEPATSASVTTGTVTTGTAEATTGSTSAATAPGTASSAPLAAPIATDPTWTLLIEPYYVWGVAAGDVLNARTGPGVSHPIVTTLAPGTKGVRVYSPYERVGQELWRPIQVGGGAAWVNARYLRPVGPDTPRITGSTSPAVTTAATTAADALRRLDLPALAALVGPNGVRISPHAFVGDDAVTLSAAQITGAATDKAVLLWGYTDGAGDPIRETVLERLRAISGYTALTSTSTIGYDVRVRNGNSIDNIADVFPGDPVVEYNFGGTSQWPDYDWTSVRLVFDASGPTPRLVAIVQDTWTI